MSNYTKTTNFAVKDSLASGDTNKVVRGTELNAEYDNIATAVSTKLDTNSTTYAKSGANADLTSVSALASINGSWPSGFKNKLIGGDFTTNPWQRGTSFPGVTTGSYYADRWVYGKVGTSVHSISKVIDAPTAAQSGVYATSCIALNVSTAETPIAAGDYCILQQSIEGYNAAPFGFGQVGAKNVTLSFWVKGAKTGIHCIALRNGASNRSYVAEYTIIGINTWEYKTIIIPVDVAGTWTYDNSTGIVLTFCLASSSVFQTTSNSWQTGNFLSTANQVNELDSVGNTFKVALVQLETGSVATQFETRGVGQEFTLCQRYYQTLSDFLVSGNNGTGSGIFTDGTLTTPMRAQPTATVLTAITYSNASAYAFNGVTANKFRLGLTITTSGYGYAFNGILTFSAEL